MQIWDHPVLGEASTETVTLYFEGEPFKARKGQTIAAALMANGVKKLGVSRKLRQPQGIFCASGRCCSCFMTVNGWDHVLTCMTLAEEGMRISVNDGDPDVRRDPDGD